MSKIKFCALGGLGENGKNLYLVTVDEKIFILDAGLKYPSIELYGIDVVIPDFSYLVQNKDKIVGLFLSHGHDEYYGAVGQLLKNINVPVFGSHFTISMVEVLLSELNMDIAQYKLYRINDDKVLEFNNVTVSFFYTTHSVPESMGISINTEDGSIVYVPDFCLTFTKDHHYQTSFDKLANLSKNKVLLLLPESLGVNNVNRVDNDYMFNHTIHETLINSKRTIFTMFSYDLNRIQKVIDLCVANNRRVAILGRKVQRTINVAMSINYLNCPPDKLVNLKFIDNTTSNDEDDLAIIITGIRHEPYFMLQRMMSGVDKLIRITEKDTIVIVSPPVLGTEKIATRAIDQLSKAGANVVNIPRNIIKSSHADGEDLKMLYQMVKPLYICPVIGEYRHQYIHRDFAIEAGYNEKQVIVLENGEQITFVSGELQRSHDKISVADVLIDGSIVGDINEVVLKDRECLSEDGAVIVVINIDAIHHRIISGPKVVARGFISEAAMVEVNDEIANTVNFIIEKQLKNTIIDWNQLKTLLRDNITKVVRDMTKKNPIIIPVIIDMNGEDL